jgi:hypothetical protein
MIEVIDDYLPEEMFESIQDNLSRYGMLYGWKANGDSDPHGHWNHNISNSHSENLADISDILTPELKSVWDFIRPKQHHIDYTLNDFVEPILLRCYVNSHTYGNDGYFHKDSLREDETTIVLYLNDTWDKDFAGETTFIENNEIIKSVLPKRNRAVIFNGNNQHCARGVSRKFNGVRQTLMFKFRNRRSNFEKLSKFLYENKATHILHTNGTLHDHLVRVFQLLEDRGCPEEICLAGGLHSVFGTNIFKNKLFNISEQFVLGDVFGHKVSFIASMFATLDRPKTLENYVIIDNKIYLNSLINEPYVVSYEILHALQTIECANLQDQKSLTKEKYPNLYAFWN